MSDRIREWLPHRPPVLFVDELLEGDTLPQGVPADSAVAIKTFPAGSFGTDGNRVLESALIECAAQTVAALNGCNARKQGQPLAQGMLVGVNDFEFPSCAHADVPLRIAVKIVDQFGPFCMAEGQVEQEGAVVAKGALKFYTLEQDGETQTM
jgi:3-hydroxymyristoyl/3-hydroxydecanoyl-(acyl carrier protein) dehydratase